MWDMEKISNYLAAKIAFVLKHDKDFEEVLAYGAFAILQTFWSIFLTLIFGIIFKAPLEAVIISFAASILRKYSGGVHATTPNRCAAIATIIFVSIAIFVSNLAKLSLIVNILYCSSCFSTAYYITYKKAPKDTPNKPITEEAIKRCLRNNAIKTIHVFLLTSIVLLFLYYKMQYNYLLKIATAIASGTIWQSITLTDYGGLVISNLDSLLGKVAYSIGGEKQ